MRYLSSKKAILDNQLYKDKLEKRGRKKIEILRTVDFKSLQGKEYEINFYGLWDHSTSLHKISQQLYGTMEYWWTIGLINEKPTDQHWAIGDEIYTPASPNLIKNAIGSKNV